MKAMDEFALVQCKLLLKEMQEVIRTEDLKKYKKLLPYLRATIILLQEKIRELSE